MARKKQVEKQKIAVARAIKRTSYTSSHKKLILWDNLKT
jgi:hypothetical protein